MAHSAAVAFVRPGKELRFGSQLFTRQKGGVGQNAVLLRDTRSPFLFTRDLIRTPERVPDKTTNQEDRTPSEPMNSFHRGLCSAESDQLARPPFLDRLESNFPQSSYNFASMVFPRVHRSPRSDASFDNNSCSLVRLELAKR